MYHRTIILYGRAENVKPDAEGCVTVAWKDAVNFADMAPHMLQGEYESAVVVPVNSTHGSDDGANVRITIDHEQTTFKGFVATLWCHDRRLCEEDSLSVTFDWVAFIPCAESLT
jgi:hypothetical protein